MSDKEQIWENTRKDAIDADFVFFTRWATISAGLLALLIPLLESLKGKIIARHALYFGEIFLLFSLLLSLSGLFLSHEVAQTRMEEKVMWQSSIFTFSQAYQWKKKVKLYASITFVIGIILVIYFANTNLIPAY